MATGECEQTSDEIINFKCTPCAKTNKRREAVKYCVECQGYCCQSCIDTHKVFPALACHRLLDKSNFKSTVLTTDLPSVPTDICSIHEMKIVDVYCGNHDVVGCANCMRADHRNCSDVKLILDVVDTLFKASDVKETDLILREKTTAVEKLKTQMKNLLDELHKSKAKAVEAITNFRKDMDELLQNLERESLKELEKEFQKMKNKLEDELRKFEKKIGSMRKAADDLKLSDGNNAQQFVSMKTAQKKIKETDDILQLLETHFNAKVYFTANIDVRNYLQQLNDVGSVTHSRNSVYTVTGTRELNVKLQGDSSTCTVFGSCLTTDGKLLLADNSNKKLKRADIMNLSVEDYCQLSTSPISVCCISEDEAVVSLYNSIQFVSLCSQMTPTHEIKINHYCFGIACRKEKLYITDNRKSLYIHDMAGRLLQTISRDSSGRDIFTNSRNIAFGDFGDRVFVGDFQNKLVILDEQGKYISSLDDPDLNNGTGVCTDSRGNVFVCGYNSKNVMQLNQNGTKMGVVVKTTDRLKYAWSLAFDPKLGILCVTQHNSDSVKLFDLQ